MDRDRFWGLVEAARAMVDDTVADPDGVADALVKALSGMGAEEIVGFGVQFDLLQAEAYRWDLWGAAYLINGGASDDSFDYFRGWLVAQGQETWDAALADPDSLADVIDEDLDEDFEGFDGEALLAVGSEAYAAGAGSAKDFWGAVDAATPEAPDVPGGQTFDFDDEGEMHSRFPRLAALYLEE
ncbi:uncharacterized protein DUF4240 [Kribbella amoyensis]|uniref:Uncharacterized protein DUF4240 n=1 Tax=Kribbella amoyensis TaxID=996641 RepID=A0A561BPN3_9ACTN|nr:DUF4240 domain-containing protein [Kribbella amoyensis]TWD80828.1 uncharacterized protein DUF4240 [Kribbella amoyensis]